MTCEPKARGRHSIYCKPGVPNSNCSEGQTKTYKETRGPRYGNPRAALWRWRNNCGTWTLPETALTSYFLRKVSWVVGKSFLTFTAFILKERVLFGRLKCWVHENSQNASPAAQNALAGNMPAAFWRPVTWT